MVRNHQFERVSSIYLYIEAGEFRDEIISRLEQAPLKNQAHLLRLTKADRLLATDSADLPRRVATLIEAAQPWVEYEAMQIELLKAEAWRKCEGLAKTEDILGRAASAVRDAGVIGEDRAVKLIYLMVTTRLLQRPVSGKVHGPSSGGKSITVQSVLQLFPASAYYLRTSMSERALAYTDEPLSHRFLILAEAAGMGGDIQNYLIRSLLSEGRLVHETVEAHDGQFRSRKIEREGPTGLLITTTELRLHPENETRLLSIPVNDTPDQTRAVLKALASKSRAEPPDVEPWVALQEWLAHAEHRVVIPYAAELAELVPPIAVRLRRDFGAVLTLTEAHAILHQATRDRDDYGRIVAALDDYEAVRELVVDLVSERVEATVSVTVRETCDAIRRLAKASGGSSPTVTMVARELGLDVSTASRRINYARSLGHVGNSETKANQPARLFLADPLPEGRVILPPADALSCCAVAQVREELASPPSALDDQGPPSSVATEDDYNHLPFPSDDEERPLPLDPDGRETETQMDLDALDVRFKRKFVR